MSSVACSPITTLQSDITTEDDPSCPPPKRVRIRKTAPAAMKDQMTTATTMMTKATTMTTMKTPTEGGKEVVMELEESRDFADTDNNQWTIDNGNTQQSNSTRERGRKMVRTTEQTTERTNE
jgi:hypothetical protein